VPNLRGIPAPSSEVDVLVAGAGPAGSAVAFWLAQSGHRVLLVDRCDFPRDKACSEYLGPGAVEQLARIGVLSQLQGMGANALTGTTVIAAYGSRLTGRFHLASSKHPGAVGLSVTRRLLDHCLVRAAAEAGAEFVPRTTVEDLLIADGMVEGALLRDVNGSHRAIRARLTIGADGLRSVVARRIGGVETAAPRRMGFVTHVRGVKGLETTAQMHVGPAGYVGLNPLGQDIANVALVVPAARAVAARGRADDFFFSVLDELPDLRGRVPRSGMLHPVMVTGPFSSRARRVIADGALLVGDAADFFDPFTGEGIFSALRGAELAASVARDALSQPGPVSVRRLRPYAASRRRTFFGKWAVERLIGYGMLAPALFDRAVARLGRRGSMAHTLIGVTADFVPAGKVLNPLFLARMIV
jgi:flavin-dependent dehydrogenase